MVGVGKWRCGGEVDIGVRNWYVKGWISKGMRCMDMAIAFDPPPHHFVALTTLSQEGVVCIAGIVTSRP